MTTTNHEKDGKAYASVRRVALALVLAASLLACAHAWGGLTGLAWSAQPPTRTATELRQAPFVLGTDWGGVHSYSIPGELESNSTIKLAGVLHIYLKALKWPVSAVLSQCNEPSRLYLSLGLLCPVMVMFADAGWHLSLENEGFCCV